MTIQHDLNSPETVLSWIDAVVDELLALRVSVRSMLGASPSQAESASEKASILDVILEAPGHRVFQSAEEVSPYLSTERAAWDN